MGASDHQIRHHSYLLYHHAALSPGIITTLDLRRGLFLSNYSTAHKDLPATMTKGKQKAKTTTGRLPFPHRVHNVLKLAEENNQEHIIAWENNGTAFKVHSLEEFEKNLLPKYFNTQKYATFSRTLCAYGFECVRTGRQTGICKSHINSILTCHSAFPHTFIITQCTFTLRVVTLFLFRLSSEVQSQRYFCLGSDKKNKEEHCQTSSLQN